MVYSGNPHNFIHCVAYVCRCLLRNWYLRTTINGMKCQASSVLRCVYYTCTIASFRVRNYAMFCDLIQLHVDSDTEGNSAGPWSVKKKGSFESARTALKAELRPLFYTCILHV